MIHFGHNESSDRTSCGRLLGASYKRFYGDPRLGLTAVIAGETRNVPLQMCVHVDFGLLHVDVHDVAKQGRPMLMYVDVSGKS